MRYTGFGLVVLGVLVGGFCWAAHAGGPLGPGSDLPGPVLLAGLTVSVALVGAGVGAWASGRKGYTESAGRRTAADRDGSLSGPPDSDRPAAPSAGRGSGQPAAGPRG
jgi:hypothetical protein